MSVVVETSLGDIVIDIHKQANLAAKNFIKLCKAKFYNGALFYNVQKDYLASIKTINPPTTIYNQPYFEDQIHPLLKHNQFGVIATSNSKPHANNSDFYILLSQKAPQLDSKHTVFGQVMEGFEVLEQLNKMHIDDDGRPLLNIRIKHTHILDDPFEDDLDIEYPSRSPSPNYKAEGRIEFEEKIAMEEDEEQLIKKAKQHQAKKRAVTLELLGDLPDADMKPPENVLYVCKLNPITQEKDLEVIFSKFGGIKSCEVVRDWKTGSSLQYAFIEFETIASCEEAYMKMENALIDERRIHVDFCQSAHQQWSLLQRAQRKKKELNLQRELAQKTRNKEQSLIEQLELKKDYFHTKSNHVLVVDQQEIQRLKEEQLEQLLQQQLENQQKLQQQQQIIQLEKEKKKKEKKEKKDESDLEKKKKKATRNNDRSRSRSRSRSLSSSYSRRRKQNKQKYSQTKHQERQKEKDKGKTHKDDKKKEKESSKLKSLSDEKDKKPKLTEKEQAEKNEKEKQNEKEKIEKERIEKEQKEKEKKEKEQKEKEQKEKEQKEQLEKEKQRQKEKEREREKEKEREREREKERKQREKERQLEKEKEKEKLKLKEKEKEQTKLEQQNQKKQEPGKKQDKKQKRKRSSSSSSSDSSSSSSSSSDSDSSSDSSSSSSSSSDK